MPCSSRTLASVVSLYPIAYGDVRGEPISVCDVNHRFSISVLQSFILRTYHFAKIMFYFLFTLSLMTFFSQALLIDQDWRLFRHFI